MNVLPRIAYGLIAIAVAFVGGEIHGRYAQKAECAQVRKIEIAKAEKLARTKEKEYADQLRTALENSIRRQNRLSLDAAAARAESSRLHDSLSDLRRKLPDLTREAVNRYADTASVVFGECVEAYSGLAKQADAIDSDRQTLADAWPQ
jgi:hypothetical protein